jgi:hypothetical protein
MPEIKWQQKSPKEVKNTLREDMNVNEW